MVVFDYHFFRNSRNYFGPYQCCGAGPILTGSGSDYRLQITQFLKHKFK